MSPRNEVSGKRPSPLSAVFREWADGPLADWTRHLDVDWVWYCPQCGQAVVLIEEKTEASFDKHWNVTRRLATRHTDSPWAWLVVCNKDGTYSVTGARNNGSHQSFGERTIGQDDLLAWVTKAFEQHYSEQGHRRNT